MNQPQVYILSPPSRLQIVLNAICLLTTPFHINHPPAISVTVLALLLSLIMPLDPPTSPRF